MARNNRGRGSRNNNSEGRNQSSGVIGTARAKPLSAVAVVGGAVIAGVLLWTRQSQISDQIGNLAYQVSRWRKGKTSSDSDTPDSSSRSVAAADEPLAARRSQAEIAEEALTLKEIGQTT